MRPALPGCSVQIMPAKWTTSHTFQVIFGSAAAVLAFLAKDPAYGPWASPVLSVLIAVQLALGVTSGKGVGGGSAPLATIAFVLGFGITALHLAACTPAQGAALANLPGLVLQDIEAGKGLPQIEADVSASIVCPGAAAGSCKTSQEIDAIVDEILVLLTDLGVIPPGLLPNVQAMHATLQARHP